MNRLSEFVGTSSSGVFLVSLFLGGFSCSTLAKSILAPVGPYVSYQSAMSPILDIENDGAQFNSGLGYAENGNSSATLSFTSTLFSRPSLEAPRKGGWSLGMAVGTSSFDEVQDSALTAGHYFWEAHFGRGTTDIITTGDSGLRGYLELAFRDSRPHHYSDQDKAFFSISRQQYEHERYAVIRLGAGKEYGKKGLVIQKSPSIYSWSLETAFYIPVEVPSAIITVKPSLLLKCFVQGLSCGLSGLYLFQSNTGTYAQYEDLKHGAWLGPEIRYTFKDIFSVRLNSKWAYYRSPHETVFSKYPRGDLSLSIAL